MNAYIASFMLLLFNAVGLAVPASAAAEERLIPDLESTAELAEMVFADAGLLAEAVPSETSVLQTSALTESRESLALAIVAGNTKRPTSLAATAPRSGDKLEHVEGAP